MIDRERLFCGELSSVSASFDFWICLLNNHIVSGAVMLASGLGLMDTRQVTDGLNPKADKHVAAEPGRLSCYMTRHAFNLVKDAEQW